MGATKKLFNDTREVQEYEPFNHHENFNKKVKYNWLSNEEFAKLKSASLIELTQALIDKKLSQGYLEEIMKLIDKKEGKFINDIEYIKIVSKTPIENMKRLLKKHDGVDFIIKKTLRDGLELLISNKNK